MRHYPPVEDRFWEKVFFAPDGCWYWMGSFNSGKYAQIRTGKGRQSVHRWSYEHHVGPIPEGFTIDHLCNEPRCVRPEHLRAVTLAENILAAHSNTRARQNSVKVYCDRGHRLVKWNLVAGSLRVGKRVCRSCMSGISARHYAESQGRTMSDNEVRVYADLKYEELGGSLAHIDA